MLDNEMVLLSELLGDISVAKFASRFWGKQPLRITGAETSPFHFTLSQIEELLALPGLGYPYLDIVSKGRRVGEQFSSTIQTDNRTDISSVLKSFLQGETVVIQKAHLLSSALFQLTQRLENEMLTKVRANIYISSPFSSSGFKPHYDNHDVFVVQLHGAKRWRLYEKPVTLSTVNQPISTAKSNQYTLKMSRKEFDLKKGDVMYIPRGWVHNAFTLNSESVHITIGVYHSENPTIPDKHCSYFVGRHRINLNGLVRRLNTMSGINSLWSDRSAFNGAFRNKIGKAVINVGSVVSINTQLRFKLISNNKQITLESASQILKIPSVAGHVIENILRYGTCKISYLSNCLDDDAKLTLVENLWKFGLVTIADTGIVSSRPLTKIDWGRAHYFSVKPTGEIVNPAKAKNVTQRIRHLLISLLTELKQRYPNRLVSTYLRGSNTVAGAVSENSDVDIIVIVSQTKTKERLKTYVRKKYSPAGVDIHVYTPDQVRYSNKLRFALKTQALLIDGEDIAAKIPVQFLEKKNCYLFKSFTKDATNMLAALQLATDIKIRSRISAGLMKLVLRCAFESIMIKEFTYTKSPVSCYKSLIKYYPEQEVFFYQVLILSINPITDVHMISKIISTFKAWKKTTPIYE